jgi:hypothetical protein
MSQVLHELRRAVLYWQHEADAAKAAARQAEERAALAERSAQDAWRFAKTMMQCESRRPTGAPNSPCMGNYQGGPKS